MRPPLALPRRVPHRSVIRHPVTTVISLGVSAASSRSRPMRSYKKNSEWERRTRDLLTDRGLVGEALGDERAFRKLMGRYRPVVVDYLKLILVRQKLVGDGHDAAAAPA